MKKLSLASLVLIVSLLATGCSMDSLPHAGYETMRSISNNENAQDPNYNEDGIVDYNQYKGRRDSYLEEQKEAVGE